jgi:hypothetical protein
MRIVFKTEGGFATFPGLNRPMTIDSTELAEQDAAELARLVEGAHFFAQSAVANAPPVGAADYRQYTITVEDGPRQHTVRLTDPIPAPELQALVQFLQRQVRGR